MDRESLNKIWSAEIDCAETNIISLSHETANMWFSTIVGCGKEWNCNFNYDNNIRKCEESETSKQKSFELACKDRLRLQADCPEDKIEITGRAKWSAGGDYSLRANACGYFYLCTFSPGIRKIVCEKLN